MDNANMSDWKETAIAVEKERLKMIEDADKARRKERIATAIMAGIYNNVVNAAIDSRTAANYATDGAEALIAEIDGKE